MVRITGVREGEPRARAPTGPPAPWTGRRATGSARRGGTTHVNTQAHDGGGAGHCAGSGRVGDPGGGPGRGGGAVGCPSGREARRRDLPTRQLRAEPERRRGAEVE